MSAITPHYRSVTQLLQSRSFSIDEYQREYKWERRHIEELLSDLLARFWSEYRDGDSPKDVSSYGEYFLGSIIVTERAGKSYLVDGQQRVTSLTLLMIHLYRIAKQAGLSVASTIEPLIFSDNFGEPQFNLDIQERVPVIRALFNGEEYNPDGKEESVGTILARYHDIESLDLAGELGVALQGFIYWLMNNVGLIEISTASDSQAYGIFETMNDRGKPLSPVDMLKAYLLAPIVDDEDRRRANSIWKKVVLDLISWGDETDPERDANAMKAWLRAQYANSVRERKAGAVDRDWELIGTTFHRWIRDNETRVGTGKAPRNLEVMTEELPFFSAAYQLVLQASNVYTPGLESVYYNAHNDFTWQNTVLLAPLDPDDDQETVRRKLAATATYLDIWLMRRTVNYIRVGYSSTSYAMYLLVKDIRRKPLAELVAILTDRLANDDVDFNGSESRGRRGISDLGLNQFSRRYIYHLLARVTSYVEVGSGKPDLFDKYVDRAAKNPSDVEHIWADKFDRYRDEHSSQEEFDNWRNNVAGLLLLPADVNRSYQAKTFEEKAPHYAKHNLYAASLTTAAYEHQPQFQAFRSREELPFRAYDKFGKPEQLERRDLLLALANKIWSPERIADYSF
ncbi:DUF262 domain-containing protein [Mycetocola zhujimingii]|uniref:DUF262 domain-containing protein n=1 Tax=Mycetocola zhujimingii TaxID=2079792 RepID=A0A2U1TC17_9MICO|nr:DUF262 domain-containing protein [Mycetocola zhujimingii]PWC06435.1 hypothetical protein DF223_12650 [Mycetocola zhujimingii]